ALGVVAPAAITAAKPLLEALDGDLAHLRVFAFKPEVAFFLLLLLLGALFFGAPAFDRYALAVLVLLKAAVGIAQAPGLGFPCADVVSLDRIQHGGVFVRLAADEPFHVIDRALLNVVLSQPVHGLLDFRLVEEHAGLAQRLNRECGARDAVLVRLALAVQRRVGRKLAEDGWVFTLLDPLLLFQPVAARIDGIFDLLRERFAEDVFALLFSVVVFCLRAGVLSGSKHQ